MMGTIPTEMCQPLRPPTLNASSQPFGAPQSTAINIREMLKLRPSILVEKNIIIMISLTNAEKP